jgi:hypothetical protein
MLKTKLTWLAKFDDFLHCDSIFKNTFLIKITTNNLIDFFPIFKIEI